MKIYPDAWKAFEERSGSIRTKASANTFAATIRQLHQLYPVPVEKLTIEDLTAFCLAKLQNGKPPMPATVKLRKAVCQSFFAWLEWAKLIPSNPASQLKFTVRAGSGNSKEGRWLSEEEVATIIRACPNTAAGRRNRVIIMIGFFTGLRRNEIAGLSWASFDRHFKTIRIMGKGNKYATVGVPGQLQDVLLAWRAEVPPNGVLFPAMHPPTAWRAKGVEPPELNWTTPLGYRGVEEAIKKVARDAGIPIAPHDMRRTFAGLLRSKDVPLDLIRDALRHAEIGTTDRYLKKDPNRVAAVAAGFKLEL